MKPMAPFNGMRYAHKAIRAEVEALERTAEELGPTAGESDNLFAERFGFFTALMRGHWGGEEEVLWPALEAKVPQVTRAYTMDHHREYEVFNAIEELLSAMQTAETPEERAEHCRRLRREVIALNTAVTQHSRKEDAHIIPLVEDLFTHEEQEALSGGMMAHIPREHMGRAAVMVMRAVDGDEREDYTRMIMAKMPPPAFRGLMSGVKDSISSAAWSALVERVPELREMVA